MPTTTNNLRRWHFLGALALFSLGVLVGHLWADASTEIIDYPTCPRLAAPEAP